MGNCKPTYKGIRYNSLEELYESNQISPEQKQQAQQLYSQYLEQGSSQEDIEGFKEFARGEWKDYVESRETDTFGRSFAESSPMDYKYLEASNAVSQENQKRKEAYVESTPDAVYNVETGEVVVPDDFNADVNVNPYPVGSEQYVKLEEEKVKIRQPKLPTPEFIESSFIPAPKNISNEIAKDIKDGKVSFEDGYEEPKKQKVFEAYINKYNNDIRDNYISLSVTQPERYKDFWGDKTRKLENMLTNSLVGKAIGLTLSGFDVEKYSEISSEIQSDLYVNKEYYAPDSKVGKFIYDMGDIALPFLADAPVFKGLNSASGATVKGLGMLTNRISRGLSITSPIIKNKLARSIAIQTTKGTAQSSLLLGSYDALNNVATQMQNGHSIDDIEWSETMKSAKHGMVTGAILGIAGSGTSFFNKAVDNRILNLAQKNSKLAEKIATVAKPTTGVLGFLTEATAFATAESINSGEAMTRDSWAESVFMLLSMKSVSTPSAKPIDGLRKRGVRLSETFTDQRVNKGIFKPTVELHERSNYETLSNIPKDVSTPSGRIKYMNDVLSRYDVPFTTQQKALWGNAGIAVEVNIRPDRTVIEKREDGVFVNLLDSNGDLLSTARYDSNAEAVVADYVFNRMIRDRKMYDDFNSLNGADKIKFEGIWNGDKMTVFEAFNTPVEMRTIEQNRALDNLYDAIQKSKTKEVVEATKKEVETSKEEAKKPIEEVNIKEEKDAIQKQETESISTRKEPEVGKEMGQEVRGKDKEVKEKEVIDAEKGKEIPADVLSKSKETFDATIKDKKVSEADAAIEARKTIERSDWYNGLNDAQKKEASAKMDESIERFTSRPTEKKTREKTPTAENAEEVKTTKHKVLLDRLRNLEKGSMAGKKEAKEDYYKFIDDVKNQFVESASMGQTTPKGKPSVAGKELKAKQAERLINTANRAAKATTDKAKSKYLEKIKKLLYEINDPYVEKEFTSTMDNFDNISVTEKVTKIGDGKKIKIGTKTMEFAETIKAVNEYAKKMLESPESATETRESIETKLMEAKSESAKKDILNTLSDLDMSFHELGSKINELNNVRELFADTKRTEYQRRIDLLDRAEALMNDIVKLEEASIKSKKELKETREKEFEARQKIREQVKVATITTKRKTAEDAVDKFMERSLEIGNEEARKEAIAELDKSNLSSKEKAYAKKRIESATQEDAIKRVIGLNALKAGAVKYQNLRGLMTFLSRNSAESEVLLNLDKMADNSYAKAKELGFVKEKAMRGIKEALYEIESSDTFAVKSWKKTKGGKYYNRFELPQKELGVSGNMVLKPTTDGGKSKKTLKFSRLSYRDIVFIDRTLRDPANRDIVEKTLTKESVDKLIEHCKNVIKDNGALKKLSEHLDVVADDLYNINNEAHIRDFHNPLYKGDNYIQRVSSQKDVKIDKSNKVQSKSLIPNAILNRKMPHEIELVGVDFVNNIDRAFDAAINWNAYGDTRRTWNTMFAKKEIRDHIEKNVPHGKRILKSLDVLYENYPTGMQLRVGGKIFNNTVMSKILANVSLLPKQISSLPNAMTHYDKLMEGNTLSEMASTATYMYRFVSSPWKPFFDYTINDPSFRTRLKRGHDPHVISFLESSPLMDKLINLSEKSGKKALPLYKRVKEINETIKKLEGTPMVVGDAIAFMGIKPNFDVLYNRYKRTMSETEAGKKAAKEAVAEAFRTQQPSDAPHLMSAFQLSNFGKFFPYVSAPIQMGQNLVEGINKTFAKSSTTAERIAGAKQVFYYGYVQPKIWTSFASIFSTSVIKALMRGDDEKFTEALSDATDIANKWDVLETLADGATQGYPLVKWLKDNTADQLKGTSWYNRSILPMASMIDEQGKNFALFVKDINEVNGDFSRLKPNEKKRFWRLLSDASGSLTGHGTPSIFRYIDNSTYETKIKGNNREQAKDRLKRDTKNLKGDINLRNDDVKDRLK